MRKDLYTYICLDCKKTFRTDNPDQKVCPTCLKYRQPHHKSRTQKTKTKTKPKPLTFAEISHIADIYYKIHHKVLHYGDIVSLISLNPKKCICCGATVTKGNHLCADCKKRSE